MADREFDPLFGEAPLEIPLARAPLSRVVAQVMFAEILSVRSPDFMAPFQEAIRLKFPHHSRHDVQTILATIPQPEIRSETIWRFEDGTRNWRVSLATNFIALETKQYTSRADFIERLHGLLASLREAIKPTHVTRIGVRYVDHVKDPEMDGVAMMLRQEMVGVADSAIRRSMQHSITETVCGTAEGMLLARWGMLPPNGSHDPGVLQAVPTKSWFLDLDVFRDSPDQSMEFDEGKIREVAFALATRAYSFFRWATTEEFLKAYGGQP